MKRILFAPLLILALAIPACAAKNIQIITKSLAQGQTTVPYSVDLNAKFGVKPYGWSVISGALPTGLAISTLSNGKGRISGTPTVAGTFNFTVQVTGSTTDEQSLYIVITGAAPPPTPPVSITTGSVPDGVVGGAYSTTLQATGGTPPYSWSITAGALPPGISLAAATGVISGTPTASGSYPFTALVTDSSATPQTDDQALAITIATGGTYLFSDDLSTSFAAWSEKWDATNTIIAACPGGGNCAQIHYVICGDSTNPACGAAHQDRNLYVQKSYNTSALPEVWHRTYFCIKPPEAGASNYAGRKIIYDTAGCFNCSLFPSGDPYSIFISAVHLQTDTWPGAGPMKLVYGFQGATIGGPVFNLDCGSGSNPITGPGCAVAYNTFYSLEVRMKYNTALAAPWNGEVQIWLNGTSILNLTGQSLNQTTPYHLRTFRVGAQEDRDNYNAVDIYHYIKNVVINNSYIGP